MEFNQVVKASFAFIVANNGTIQSYPAGGPDKLGIESRTNRTEIGVERDPDTPGHWRVQTLRNGAGEKTSADIVTVSTVEDLTAQLLCLWDKQELSLPTAAADTITEIFSEHLPSVPFITAKDFSVAMHAYFRAFQTLRASCMCYEELPEYKGSSYIMQIPADHFWPYTPHFRKVVALTIENLFTTTITSLGTSACTMEQSLSFVDKHRNRFHMAVTTSASDKNLIRIEIFFPRSNTDTISCGKRTPIAHLADSSYLKEKKLGIITEDINYLLGRAEQ